MTRVLHFSSNDNDLQTGALENFIWTKKKPETGLMLMTPVGEGGLCGHCNGDLTALCPWER